MSRASQLGRVSHPVTNNVEEVEGITVMCKRCFTQVDVVKYDFTLKLLFWECPNGHRDFIEDFEL